MNRDSKAVELDERGSETHLAFGSISASRVSQGGGGKVLFDSDVKHAHYVVVKISGAVRDRKLQRDWIYQDNRPYIEVAMSESQWASFVSSMNTSGVPCTINWTKEHGYHPLLELDSRLALSHQEVKETAKRSMEKIEAAFAAVKEKPTKANIRALETQVQHLPANVSFAAESLTEHAENVVNKVRSDIEAYVVTKARQLGVDPEVLLSEDARGALGPGSDADAAQ